MQNADKEFAPQIWKQKCSHYLARSGNNKEHSFNGMRLQRWDARVIEGNLKEAVKKEMEKQNCLFSTKQHIRNSKE